MTQRCPASEEGPKATNPASVQVGDDCPSVFMGSLSHSPTEAQCMRNAQPNLCGNPLTMLIRGRLNT